MSIRLGVRIGFRANGDAAASSSAPAPVTELTGYDFDPDSHLTLSGSDITVIKSQVTASVDLTRAYEGANVPTRVSADLNGYGVYLGGTDFSVHKSAAGKTFATAGLTNASGGIAFVIKPPATSRACLAPSDENPAKGVVIKEVLDGGTPKIQIDYANSASMFANGPKVACSTGAWHYGYVRWAGGHIYLSIDGSAEADVAMSGSAEVECDGRFTMGGDANSGWWWNAGKLAQFSFVAAADAAARALELKTKFGL